MPDDTRTQGHYSKDGNEATFPPHIQPVEFIVANDIPFMEGNVIKYVSRWRAKGGLRDLYAARTYLDWIIRLQEERERLTPPAS